MRSRFGWHVLRLQRRIPGRQLPFEHVLPRIALHLESRAWTAAAARYVSGLAAEARERGVALSVADDGALAPAALSLGDLLNDRSAVAARLEAWLDQADPALADRARKAAGSAGVGLAEFIRDIIQSNAPAVAPAKAAFLASYSGEKKGNRFTKVQMALDADKVLQDYFAANLRRIEKWFNVISPKGSSMERLKTQIDVLSKKNWPTILKT